MDDLITKCKELGIDYLNKKTNKPFGKPSLLKKIAEKSSLSECSQEEVLINYKNEVIWTTIENKDYTEYENKLLSLIKKCHNILYSNGAIVGSNASNDIIKLLILRFLNVIYKTDKGKDKLDKLIEKQPDKLKDRYLPYVIDINNIIKVENGNYENEIKLYLSLFLPKLLPDIFDSFDGTLNTRNEPLNIYNIIIEICKTIDLTDTNLSNYFSTQGGNIYEYFTNNYSKGANSKELGQFFTPYSLIKAILNGCGFNDLIREIENPSLYDPCCGSGGLLCITYKENKDFINSNLIYGGEIEKHTIKYALGSFIINTNELNTNILNCDSLSKNPYIFEDKKFDIIFTNPPFGINNNYKDKKKAFDLYKIEKFEDSIIKFEDVYPLNISDGTAMFIQLVIYLLKTNGICAIVLPDGKMMDSGAFYKLRKLMIDKAKILKIINVSSGAFGHTSIKTKVIIFKKRDNSDNTNHKSIEFIEISKNCNEVKLIAIKDLDLKTLSFNLEDEKEEVIEYTDETKTIEFGKIFKLIKGTIQSSKVVEDENGDGVMITQSKKISDYKRINNWIIDGENLFIGNIDSGKKFVVTYYNGKCDYTNLMSLCQINEDIKDKINIKYIYYYLFDIKDILTVKYLKGAANLSLDVEKFNLLKIPIPSMERQKEIVNYLDFIYEKAIKTSNEKIAELKQLNEYSLNNQKLFGKNEIKKLGDICEFSPKKNKLKASDGLNDGLYNFYTSSQYKKLYYNSYEFNDYSIIIGRGGNPSIHFDKQFSISQDDIYVLKLKEDIYSIKYIYYYLNNNLILLSNGFVGLGIKHISKDYINNIKILIPSLEKQKEIVEYCEYNDLLIKQLEKEIELNKKQANEFMRHVLYKDKLYF